MRYSRVMSKLYVLSDISIHIVDRVAFESGGCVGDRSSYWLGRVGAEWYLLNQIGWPFYDYCMNDVHVMLYFGGDSPICIN